MKRDKIVVYIMVLIASFVLLGNAALFLIDAFMLRNVGIERTVVSGFIITWSMIIVGYFNLTNTDHDKTTPRGGS